MIRVDRSEFPVKPKLRSLLRSSRNCHILKKQYVWFQIRFKILPFDSASCQQAFSWYSGQAKVVGTNFPDLRTVLLETSWKQSGSQTLSNPSPAWLWQSEPTVGFTPAYSWKCIHKQRKVGPVTLVYLNFSWKFAKSADIFASTFVSTEFSLIFPSWGKSLWTGGSSRWEELADGI